MLLAGLLALGAVGAPAGEAASGRGGAGSSDQARAMAGKQIAAQAKAETAPVRACTCSQRGSEPETGRSGRVRAGGQR
jgi:hypothetical protein